MISFGTQQSMFGDITQNKTSSNLTRGSQWMNMEHRYLLQKYFNNEANYSIVTLPPQSLTLTATQSAGATSATLTVAWSYFSCIGLCTFSNGDLRLVNLTTNSTSMTWSAGLTAAATTAVTVGIQTYPLPSDYSKLKTGTVTVGNLRWTPIEIMNRRDWDNLNVFPYYADIPNNFFIWENQFHLWPIPSTGGNTITFNYKRRVPDLSLADYSTGTVSVSNGGYIVTGSGTSWDTTVNLVTESRWIQFTAPTGDNLWYQIEKVTSATSITLYQPYQGSTISGASYTIGQMPLLVEDFQDMPLWKALSIYFNSIVNNPKKHDEYEKLYQQRLALLEEYCGTKTLNVNLSPQPQIRNPNLYWQV